MKFGRKLALYDNLDEFVHKIQRTTRRGADQKLRDSSRHSCLKRLSQGRMRELKSIIISVHICRFQKHKYNRP